MVCVCLDGHLDRFHPNDEISRVQLCGCTWVAGIALRKPSQTEKDKSHMVSERWKWMLRTERVSQRNGEQAGGRRRGGGMGEAGGTRWQDRQVQAVGHSRERQASTGENYRKQPDVIIRRNTCTPVPIAV